MGAASAVSRVKKARRNRSPSMWCTLKCFETTFERKSTADRPASAGAADGDAAKSVAPRAASRGWWPHLMIWWQAASRLEHAVAANDERRGGRHHRHDDEAQAADRPVAPRERTEERAEGKEEHERHDRREEHRLVERDHGRDEEERDER